MKVIYLFFVLSVVCHAEQGSNFTTSLVTEAAAELSQENHGGKQGVMSNTEPPHARKRRHSNQGQSSGENDDVWALYGLFQLSSPQFCSSGEEASPNICQTNCNNFIDDDITDDIGCVLKLLTDLL
uniref:Glycosyl hydrolases family 22 (GH22) domain-containing protein n=1 Tax=Oryzias latipes TaxID=8090 RepID=A0A3P9L335_ORYLA